MKVTYLLLAAVFVACTDQASINTMPATRSSETNDITFVKEAVRKEHAAITSGNIQLAREIFAEDVELITTSTPVVRGKDAHKFLEHLSSAYIITAPPYTDEEFEINGDLAYHRYSFEMHIIPRKGGDTMVEKGAGIHLLRKKSDSIWVITKDIWLPLPEAQKIDSSKVKR